MAGAGKQRMSGGSRRGCSPSRPDAGPSVQLNTAARAESALAAQDVADLQRQLAQAQASLREEQMRREGAEQKADFLTVQLAAATSSLYDSDRCVSPRSNGGSQRGGLDGEDGPPGAAAAQAQAWSRFMRACRPYGLGERDVTALSESTLRQLILHVGMDRDVVDIARVELEWRKRSEGVQTQLHRGTPQRGRPEPPAPDSSPAPAARTASRVTSARSVSPESPQPDFVVTMPRARPSFSCRRSLGPRSPAAGATPSVTGTPAARRLFGTGRCSPLRVERGPEFDVPLPPYASPGRDCGVSEYRPSPVRGRSPDGSAGAPSWAASAKVCRRSASPQPTGAELAAASNPNTLASLRPERRDGHRRAQSAEAARTHNHHLSLWDKVSRAECSKGMVCGPALTAEYKPRRHVVTSSQRIFGQEQASTVSAIGQRGYEKRMQCGADCAEYRPRRTGYNTHPAQGGRFRSQVADLLSPGRIRTDAG
eukprot:TRINITY_DN251_c1_g3_i1.p1 TRINITY_DN251_c1_g3~~TRINITY_DN251_c1_g3_i1.p1  ORF type:complete len:481 (+),score=102.54 TRINITY_DN251_c1_g3_i1:70-1512(+)